MAAVSIGNELKDSFKETNNWVHNNVQFLTDVEQFYRQRSVIEKEYANSLQKLTAEFLKKKANKTTQVSVGDEPKFTPGSLESASLVAWTDILSQTESISKNHSNFSNELNIKVADQILALQRHLESLQQRVENFHQNSLLKQKQEVFDNVTKAKKAYDETCASMESTRSKAEKSTNRDKFQKKINEKEVDMNIAKNEYLLKINIANRIKDKFYYQDVPEILDLLQDLNEFKTKQTNKILKNAAIVEMNKNTRDTKNMETTIQTISANRLELDTQMFIKHNLVDWKEPQDFYYVPSSIWHDDEHFVTKPHELQNLKKTLMLAIKTNENYESSLEDSRERLNSLQTQRLNLKNVEDDQFELKSCLDTINGYLMTLSTFTSDETKKVSAQVEIETIENNAGDQDLTLDNLTITTKKTGLLTRLRGGKAEKTVVKDNGSGPVSDFDDIHSIKSSQTAKSHHSNHFKFSSLLRQRGTSVSSQATANTTGSNATTTTQLQGTALYDYQAQGDDEASISAGETFIVLQPDDGSGWTEISNNGSTGLVPTSYIQVATTTVESKRKGPQVTPRRGAKKVQYCVCKFPYQAEDEGELTINEGDRIEILQSDDGGWTMGELNGQSGMFPTSYVEIQ